MNLSNAVANAAREYCTTQEILLNAAGKARLTMSPGVICFRCVGYLFQKVGKVAATSVGGGLLLLQVRFTIQ